MEEIFESRGKQEKDGVGYREWSDSDAKMCSECANFSYQSSCAIVKGKINPDGVCEAYTMSVDKKASVVLRGFADGLKVKV